MEERVARAMVSPPRWGVVAGDIPISDRVGMAKSLLGPIIDVYWLSFGERLR